MLNYRRENEKQKQESCSVDNGMLHGNFLVRLSGIRVPRNNEHFLAGKVQCWSRRNGVCSHIHAVCTGGLYVFQRQDTYESRNEKMYTDRNCVQRHCNGNRDECRKHIRSISVGVCGQPGMQLHIWTGSYDCTAVDASSQGTGKRYSESCVRYSGSCYVTCFKFTDGNRRI